MDEETKKVLAELFDALGFSADEKGKALLDFQKKVAAEILRSVQDKLPQEQRDFITKGGAASNDPSNPMVNTMRETLKGLYSVEEYRAKAKEILRKLLPVYTDYMAQGMSEEGASRLKRIVQKL
jgi:hypothetical protein